MSLFSLFKSYSHHPILVIDIGSGSVGGALAYVGSNSHPVISATRRVPFSIKENISGELLINDMLSALSTVLHDLSKKDRKAIQSAYVIYASPWYSSFSREFNLEKKEPVLVSKKLLDDLIKEHALKLVNDAREGKSMFLERTISHIRLNGYETSAPFGKKANQINVVMYASMIPKTIYDKVESLVHRTFHIGKVESHTFPFVASHIARSLFNPEENFIFIDIGSELTDLLISERGAIRSVASFPFGKNHLIRKVATAFGVDPALAESYVRLVHENKAEQELSARIKDLVGVFSEEWTAYLSRILHTDLKNSSLPQRAFCISDDDVATFFTEMTARHIQRVTYLSSKNLEQFLITKEHIYPDPFLSVETLFLTDQKSVQGL